MVRYAEENDFDFVKTLWSTCFDDSAEFVDWNFENNYSPKDTIIAEYNGQRAATIQLRPYTLSVFGQEKECRYISGVATLPEYRGLGLVREMFDFALPRIKAEGCDIAILVPAVDGMYEKFGFRQICTRTSRITDNIPEKECVATLDDLLIERLDGIYKRAMKDNDIYIIRTKQDWNKILTDLLTLSGGAVCLFDDGYDLICPKGDKYEIVESLGGRAIEGETLSIPPVLAWGTEEFSEKVYLNLML